MEKSKMDRVLGVAVYEARWIAKSLLVRLTATGILPCANYTAQLEQRPEKVLPSMWDMVFYVEPLCVKALKPFSVEVVVYNPGSEDHLFVRDAAGEHKVPILSAIEASEKLELDEVIAKEMYCVHARLPAPKKGHQGCIVVPEGTILPAIYYHAFGPSSKEDCEKFVLENCLAFEPLTVAPGGEIPWPLAK